EISVAATAPPSGKLPSTVRSGKRSRRKEISTPSATRLKIRPISRAPSKENRDMNRVGPAASCEPGRRCLGFCSENESTRRRPGPAARGLLDDLGGRLQQRVGQADALLGGGARVDEQPQVGAGFGGD